MTTLRNKAHDRMVANTVRNGFIAFLAVLVVSGGFAFVHVHRKRISEKERVEREQLYADASACMEKIKNKMALLQTHTASVMPNGEIQRRLSEYRDCRNKLQSFLSFDLPTKEKEMREMLAVRDGKAVQSTASAVQKAISSIRAKKTSLSQKLKEEEEAFAKLDACNVGGLLDSLNEWQHKLTEAQNELQNEVDSGLLTRKSLEKASSVLENSVQAGSDVEATREILVKVVNDLNELVNDCNIQTDALTNAFQDLETLPVDKNILFRRDSYTCKRQYDSLTREVAALEKIPNAVSLNLVDTNTSNDDEQFLAKCASSGVDVVNARKAISEQQRMLTTLRRHQEEYNAAIMQISKTYDVSIKSVMETVAEKLKSAGNAQMDMDTRLEYLEHAKQELNSVPAAIAEYKELLKKGKELAVEIQTNEGQLETAKKAFANSLSDVCKSCEQTRNFDFAIELYRRLADKGDAEAMLRIGIIYEEEKENSWEARKWYAQAAAQDSVEACWRLGKILNDENRGSSEGLKLIRQAAEKGHLRAMNRYGWLHLNGIGVAKNMNEAVRWLRPAAEQGLAWAQFNMGRYHWYFAQDGVPQNYVEAEKWFRKAAMQGNSDSQVELGLLLDNVKNNYSEAVQWYRKAAEQGHAVGQNNLGYMYQEGRGVSKDYSQAAFWLRQAANQGFALAQLSLGWFYYNGEGVNEDLDEAGRLYNQVLSNPNADEDTKKLARKNLQQVKKKIGMRNFMNGKGGVTELGM